MHGTHVSGHTSPTSQPALARQRCTAGTGPMPITAGSTPALAYATIRPSITAPVRDAYSSDATSTAAAPSLIPEALPA